MRRLNMVRVGFMLLTVGALLFVTTQALSTPAATPQLPAGFSTTATQVMIPLPDVVAMASSTALSNTLLANFSESSVPFYSLDGGLKWQAVYTTPWLDGSLSVAVAPRSELSYPVRLLVAASSSAQSRVGVYRTGDFGQTWTKITFPHPANCSKPDSLNLVASPADPARLYLAKVCRYDDGEVAFPYSGIYTSDDAGITWEAVQPDTSYALWTNLTPSPVIAARVYAKNINGGWFQSDDHGLTWTEKTSPGPSLVLDSQDPDWLYSDSSYGSPFGGLGVGKRSTNGGSTWSEWLEQPCLNMKGQLMAHPTLAHVLLLRCGSGLFRSIDGGDHWIQLSSSQGQWIGADYGNLGRILWARKDGLWSTSGQAMTWTQLIDSYERIFPWRNGSPPDTISYVESIVPIASNDVWATIFPGKILHWMGQEWTKVPIPVTQTLASMALAFAAPNDGWAVGDGAHMGDNVILHWNGTAWAVITNTTNALRAVAAISETNAWAVGDEGIILQWDGTTWNTVSSPTTVTLKSIDMVSPTEGWVVGGIAIDDIMVGIYEGAILHWDGNNWSIFTTTTYIPASVDMLSATDGWIGGGTHWAGSGKILHWTGTTWQEVAHPVIGRIFSIAMVSANEGWAVAGGLPDPLHWDGDAWTVFDAPSGGGAIATLPSAEFWIGGNALLYLPPISSVYLPMLCQ